MSEYIERGAAIKAVCESFAHTCDLINCFYGCQETQSILAIPAADVVPVVHGRWMKHKSWAKCSECGYLIGFETTYCPNCGARMDGVGE